MLKTTELHHPRDDMKANRSLAIFYLLKQKAMPFPFFLEKEFHIFLQILLKTNLPESLIMAGGLAANLVQGSFPFISAEPDYVKKRLATAIDYFNNARELLKNEKNLIKKNAYLALIDYYLGQLKQNYPDLLKELLPKNFAEINKDTSKPELFWQEEDNDKIFALIAVTVNSTWELLDERKKAFAYLHTKIDEEDFMTLYQEFNKLDSYAQNLLKFKFLHETEILNLVRNAYIHYVNCQQDSPQIINQLIKNLVRFNNFFENVPDLETSQHWLINRISDYYLQNVPFKRPFMDQGFCYGLASSSQFAFHVYEMDILYHRLILMAALDADAILPKPSTLLLRSHYYTEAMKWAEEEIKKKADKNLLLQKSQLLHQFLNRQLRSLMLKAIMGSLTEEEKKQELALLDIPAFFSGILINQIPLLFNDLFREGTPLPQNNVLTFPISQSQVYEDEALSIVPVEAFGKYKKPLEKTHAFFGVYDELALKDYFDSLYDSLLAENLDIPLTFQLGSGNHALIFTWHPLVKLFTVIESSSLNLFKFGFLSTDEMALVPKCFSNNANFIFHTIVYASKKDYKKAQSFLETWQSHPKWQKWHSDFTGRYTLADSANFSLIHIAVRFGEKTVVAEAMQNLDTKKLNQNYDNDEQNLLLCAAFYGQCKVMELLLDKININLANKYGETALHVACERGHADLVNLLITKKANIKATAQVSLEDLLIYATHRGCRDQLIKFLGPLAQLPNRIPGFTPLWYAVFFGHADVVKQLLENNSPITDFRFLSPLQAAKILGHERIYQMLLAHQKNEFEKNAQGFAYKDRKKALKLVAKNVTADFEKFLAFDRFAMILRKFAKTSAEKNKIKQTINSIYREYSPSEDRNWQALLIQKLSPHTITALTAIPDNFYHLLANLDINLQGIWLDKFKNLSLINNSYDLLYLLTQIDPRYHHQIWNKLYDGFLRDFRKAQKHDKNGAEILRLLNKENIDIFLKLLASDYLSIKEITAIIDNKNLNEAEIKLILLSIKPQLKKANVLDLLKSWSSFPNWQIYLIDLCKEELEHAVSPAAFIENLAFFNYSPPLQKHWLGLFKQQLKKFINRTLDDEETLEKIMKALSSSSELQKVVLDEIDDYLPVILNKSRALHKIVTALSSQELQLVILKKYLPKSVNDCYDLSVILCQSHKTNHLLLLQILGDKLDKIFSNIQKVNQKNQSTMQFFNKNPMRVYEEILESTSPELQFLIMDLTSLEYFKQMDLPSSLTLHFYRLQRFEEAKNKFEKDWDNQLDLSLNIKNIFAPILSPTSSNLYVSPKDAAHIKIFEKVQSVLNDTEENNFLSIPSKLYLYLTKALLEIDSKYAEHNVNSPTSNGELAMAMMFIRSKLWEQIKYEKVLNMVKITSIFS